MDNLVFINIQPGQELELNNYRITSELPLPMLQEELDRLMKDKEIPWPAFVRGIIHVLAKVPNYPYAGEYKKLLYEFNPQIEEILLQEGAHLAGEGKLDVARVIFQGLANLNPGLAEAWFNLGLCYQELAARSFQGNAEQGQHYLEQAIETFEFLIGQENASPMAYYNLGFLYRQKGRLSQAKEAWEKAVELGIDEERKVELEGLINELDRLDIVEAQFESGTNAINRGKFKEGIILLQPLAKRYPHWWQVSFNLGVAYHNMGDYEKAKDIFKKVAELNPAIPEVHSQIGLCCFALGQMEEAEDALRKAIGLSNEDSGLLGNLGLVYLRQERFEEAAEVFYQALKLAPEDALIQHYIKELPDQYRR